MRLLYEIEVKCIDQNRLPCLVLKTFRLHKTVIASKKSFNFRLVMASQLTLYVVFSRFCQAKKKSGQLWA